MTAHTLVTHFAPHGFDRLHALFARLGAAVTPRPTAAQALANDVAAVRSLARSLQASDPRFAADLSAAADRSEIDA